MKNLREFEGQKALIDGLLRANASGRIGHAYIIEGAEGTGKRTFAGLLASAMLCLSPVNGDSCGRCASCRAFQAGSNPDISYIAPTKTKTISVDDIRNKLTGETAIKPYSFGKRVFIVCDGGLLGDPAQNAMLKSLEEAPAYCVFLICAVSRDKLLPTINSRAQLIRLRPLDTETVGARLTAQGMDENQARLCAAVSRGSLGRALALSQSEGFAAVLKFCEDCANKFCSGDLLGAFALARTAETLKDDAETILEILLIQLRDAAVHEILGSDALILDGHMSERLSCLGGEWLDMAAKELQETAAHLSRSANFLLTMEVMLIRLFDNKHRLIKG